MPKFEVVSPYAPSGDQPEAIEALVNGVNWGLHEQTLLGVTGSGKTFTMASVIEKLNRPTLVLAHNHVSGLAVPSEADVKLTLQLIPLLRALDIELLDHLVVADGEFVSMVRSGLIPPPRNSGV